ncbi:MAG: ATP-binding cassette domain-containing protein [Hyphomicrobiaceae bacterium]|nr:ATP-binding cassette domain-containing protein [Hyphomicrobiaceae bacterium]
MRIDVRLQHGFTPSSHSRADRHPFVVDVEFGIDARALALVGPSGSGKTTVLNAIAGIFRPAHGRILLDGTTLLDTIRKIDVRQSRRRIGYVFQDGRLFPHLTVRRNLLYGHWFSPSREKGLSLDDIVALLGIGHLMERRPSALSGGEKQRVAIGRALLAKPRLLMLDEPLAALDLERRAAILPLIEQLRDDLAMPIILVSHDLTEVARIATHIVDIREGRVSQVRENPSARTHREATGCAEIVPFAPSLPAAAHETQSFQPRRR